MKVAEENLKPTDTFAVRTVRRGSHPYTSIDVNVRAGAAIKGSLDNQVNLESPSKIIAVEIVKDVAIIGILKGEEIWSKERPGKFSVLPFLRKAAIAQAPYLGPLDAARTMGARIGREVQAFEVKELVVAISSGVRAEELSAFLAGVFEGINSRYGVQRRSYSRKPHKTQVYVQDLYQLVRERRNEPIIVLEPEGQPITSVADKVAEIFLSKEERVNLLVGSREGIPLGIYRFADLVIDVCPGATISTEYAASAALVSIATMMESKL